MSSPIERQVMVGGCGGESRRRRSRGREGPDDEEPSRQLPGDLESRNRLVQENMGLVYRVARQYVHRGLTIEDLVGEGNLGLIRAAQEYDPGQGARFSTYANFWIREAIQAALANTAATIRVPMNVARLLARWRRTERSLSQRKGHPPTFEEVAAAMDLDPAAQRLVARAHRVARLHAEEADREGGASFFRMLPDEGVTAEETLAEREEREAVSHRLERLDGTERAMIGLKYGLSGEPPLSLERIGSRLGMTVAAVQKGIASAMRKLGRVHEPHLARSGPRCRSQIG